MTLSQFGLDFGVWAYNNAIIATLSGGLECKSQFSGYGYDIQGTSDGRFLEICAFYIT